MNQQLSLITEEPWVTIQVNHVITTSLKVAEIFGKEHKNVLRDIKNLSCTEEFGRLNFEPISYLDSYGREQTAIQMTKNGFVFLVMGYAGEKAAQFKEAYIKEFDRMALQLIRLQHKRLPTTPHDVFYKNFKTASTLFKDHRKRQVYANQLTREQTGVDILEHAGIANPLPNPIVAKFWQAYRLLVEKLGEGQVNHSKKRGEIAINLQEFNQLCEIHQQNGFQLDELRRHLGESENPMLSEPNKAIYSAIANKTKRVWLFKA